MGDGRARRKAGRFAPELTTRSSRGALRAALVGLFVAASSLHAQLVVRSWLPWRTVETQHFLFHYPAELEAWTRDIASRAESIDSAVTRVVGFALSGKTHVVVDNPYGLANGSAWPFLRRTVINLWASPPTPRDDIGEFRHWGEMLLSHEFAHIAHLSRPSRNPLTRFLWELSPADLGPLTLNAPRWVIEGYATYVEGRTTGTGRPHGAWRAALLRQWALEGQLPRYEQLNGGGGYEAGEFAYLAGSAFLEWLVQRHGGGDSTLTALWRRMSARQVRTFDEAFAGVFGESAATLYGHFTAELTGHALEVSRVSSARLTPGDTGTIIQKLSWSTGDPAISADGKRVALVVRSQTRPSRVVVWSTAPEPDTGKARRDSILVAHDPEDVPAQPIFPSPKKALATLRSPGGAGYDSPRFLRDGRVLVSRLTAQGDGTLRSDLYLWDTKTDDVRRVTNGGSLEYADPLPDGRSAVASQCRIGWCDVAIVSLDDGSTRTILAGSPWRSYYRPRISPNGSRLIVSVNEGAGWQLHVAAADGSGEALVGLDVQANAYDVEWVNGDSVVAVVEANGIPNLARCELASGTCSQVTNVSGAAVAPAYNQADSSIWFLSLYSRGYDVRRTRPTVAHPVANLAFDRQLAPAIAFRAASSPYATQALPPSRTFGLGERSLRWIPEPEADADGVSAGLAIVSTDLADRTELLLNATTGDPAAWRGGSIDFVWHGMRPGVRAKAFGVGQRLSESRTAGGATDLDSRMAGGALSLDGSYQFDTWAARYRVGGSASSIRLLNSLIDTGTTHQRSLGFADAGISVVQRGDGASVSESLSGTYVAGNSLGTRVQRATAGAALTIGVRGFPGLNASGFYGTTNDDAPRFEQFAIGGSPSALVERDLLTQRVAMPVLPAGTDVGTSVFAYRGALSLQPLTWFMWTGRVRKQSGGWGMWRRVIGAEWTQSVAPISVVGTPAARVQLGAGESLDAPIRHRIRAYLNFILNP